MEGRAEGDVCVSAPDVLLLLLFILLCTKAVLGQLFPQLCDYSERLQPALLSISIILSILLSLSISSLSIITVIMLPSPLRSQRSGLPHISATSVPSLSGINQPLVVGTEGDPPPCPLDWSCPCVTCLSIPSPACYIIKRQLTKDTRTSACPLLVLM